MVCSGAEQVLEHPEYQRRFVDFRQKNHAITFHDVPQHPTPHACLVLT